jgi:putative Mg2+ transporter-C (MgtC) family protein
MCTYGIVCMASAGLVAVLGYPGFWWGHAGLGALVEPDPTRVVQGIVTGIGFLGAGVIMRDGFSISGLTTAASIWATSVIGILVGLGLYAAAIALAILTAVLMMWGARLEARLPALAALAVSVSFRTEHEPAGEDLRLALAEWGYGLADGTLQLHVRDGESRWQFGIVAQRARVGTSLPDVAQRLRSLPGVTAVEVAYARN